MTPELVGLPLQLISAGVNAGRSNRFLKQAQSELEALKKKPIKPYSANSKLTGYANQAIAEASAPKGLTPAEVALYQQNQAQTEAATMANASKVGAGRGILGIINAGNAISDSRLAVDSARMSQQNRLSALNRVGSAASQFQNLDNMNVNSNIQAQQGLGGAIRSQRENIGKAWGSLGNLGGLLTGYGLASGSKFSLFGGKGAVSTGENKPAFKNLLTPDVQKSFKIDPMSGGNLFQFPGQYGIV